MGVSISSIFNAYAVQAPNGRPAAAGRASRAEEKKDMVAFSSKARDFQAARQALANTPDIRSEVVDPIKSQIDAELYDVSAQMVADKILKGLEELM